MTLKNIIINKSLRDNDIQIKFDDALLKYVSKYNKLKSNIELQSESVNYNKVRQLDPYTLAVKNKITLYQPIENNGWYSMIDLISNSDYFDINCQRGCQEDRWQDPIGECAAFMNNITGFNSENIDWVAFSCIPLHYYGL